MRHTLPIAPQFYVTAPQACPYLDGRMERKLFTALQGEHAQKLNDTLSKQGFRRSQNVLYRPSCAECSACLSARIRVADFHQPIGRGHSKIHISGGGELKKFKQPVRQFHRQAPRCGGGVQVQRFDGTQQRPVIGRIGRGHRIGAGDLAEPLKLTAGKKRHALVTLA